MLKISLVIRITNYIKVTSISFFIPYFNLLTCELDNFAFNLLYLVILYWYYIIASEKSKIVFGLDLLLSS